jgi:hypothetical protein
MSLPPLIEALLDPRAYPSAPERVTLGQTHISYLLFTPEFVYKIKKPVDFGFLDFTTLDRRLRFCREELRLNRRLAPDVYLGVVEITDDGGRVSIDSGGDNKGEGTGEAVEYAVKMRRLKADTILEGMLAPGKDEGIERAIRRVADTIAAFHKGAAPYTGIGTPQDIKKKIEDNLAQTTKFIGVTLSEERLKAIKEYSLGFIAANTELLKRRAASGFTRDCHGDIHTEHISVGERISIIDCIEFNEAFRISDVAADIAFLSMDLDFHNRADLARILDASYFKATEDREGRALMNFYKCSRACIRGKVEGLKYLEAEITEEERAEAYIHARHHFHLALEYALNEYPRPMMIIICGLSGTGKSTLARALGAATGAVVFSSDAVRKELAGLDATKHIPANFEENIYSPEFTERTYAALIAKGVELIRAGRTCVLDATFSKSSFLDKAQAGAEEAGAGDIRIFRCIADDKDIKRRIAERRKDEESTPEAAVSDINWALYLEQKAGYEEIEPPHIIIDSTEGTKKNLKSIVEKIFG